MIPLRDVIPSRTFPGVVISIVVLNALGFLYELGLSDRELTVFLHTWGVVPARFDALAVVSSMFLHGGWMHLIGNMWFLWIFGDNVEDMLGSGRFLAFYLLAGLGAGLAHYLLQPSSAVPTVGASGAIAGVLAGYLVLFPRARITTLVPLGFFVQLLELPAMVLIGLWFAIQIGSGLLSFGGSGGGVAWWAHVGGFLVGVALVRPFLPRKVMA